MPIAGPPAPRADKSQHYATPENARKALTEYNERLALRRRVMGMLQAEQKARELGMSLDQFQGWAKDSQEFQDYSWKFGPGGDGRLVEGTDRVFPKGEGEYPAPLVSPENDKRWRAGASLVQRYYWDELGLPADKYPGNVFVEDDPIKPYKAPDEKDGGVAETAPKGSARTTKPASFSTTGVAPATDTLARVMWTKLHPDRAFPKMVSDTTTGKSNNFQDPIDDPYNHPTDVPGVVKGTKRWSVPSGDYFNGQMDGSRGSNPLADPVPYSKGATSEQMGAGPAPAPFGYTASGRPRRFAGEEDSIDNAPVGISEYAPNQIHGPTVNPYRQGTVRGAGRPLGADNGDAGASRARPI